MNKPLNLQPIYSQKKHLVRNPIEVKPSPVKDYGVFAEQIIFPGEIIEECPVVLLDNSTGKNFNPFKWDRTNTCLPLGYGAIYNHSTQPNAIQVADQKSNLFRIVAEKLIYTGDEIFIPYEDSWLEHNEQNTASTCCCEKILKKTSNIPPTPSQKTNKARWLRVILLVTLLLILAFISSFKPLLSKYRVNDFFHATTFSAVLNQLKDKASHLSDAIFIKHG